VPEEITEAEESFLRNKIPLAMILYDAVRNCRNCLEIRSYAIRQLRSILKMMNAPGERHNGSQNI
jgi:hypothetical protein